MLKSFVVGRIERCMFGWFSMLFWILEAVTWTVGAMGCHVRHIDREAVFVLATGCQCVSEVVLSREVLVAAV